MKLAFLLRVWPILGGGETVTLALANEFVKRKIIVYVLYTEKRIVQEMPFIDERIISVKVPGVEFCQTYPGRKFTDTDIKNANDFLLNFTQKEKINIIIVQWWPMEATIGVRQFSKVIKCNHMCLYKKTDSNDLLWKGKDIIKKILGENITNFVNRKISIWQTEKDLKLCDKYLFLAKGFLDEYIKESPHTSYIKKLDYCNNPISYKTDYKQDDYENKKNVVLFVGRMEEKHKRISKILKIWSIIEADNTYDDWTLKLVGSGSDEQNYKKLASCLHLKRALFEGHQFPLKYYKEAKIFLMTSALEGWGMTLVESQVNGVVPIVLDTYAACHDIIESGKNGYIVEMHDLDGYVCKLKELMTDSKKLKKMAQRGLESSMRFSVSIISDKWGKIFNELLSD